MRESIKLQWLLGDSHRESRKQELFNEFFDILKRTIKRGDITSLKNHLEKPEFQTVVNYTDADGYTLVHIAALQIDPISIKCLLNAGARPNIPDSKGRTSLHLTVHGGCRCIDCSPKRIECIQNLINGGADIDCEDNKGETPLYYAARSMYPECAETLLDLGSNLYHWNENTSVATLLVEYTPTVMKNQLDECVNFDRLDNTRLQVDFSLLLQLKAIQEGYRKWSKKLRQPQNRHSIMPISQSNTPLPRETELLQSVLKARFGKEMLITHPVVEAFLHFKWLVVRKFFFVLRSIYFVLVLLYTSVIFRMYSYKCLNHSTTIDDDEADSCQPNLINQCISGFLVFSAAVKIVTEVYELVQDVSTYFLTGTAYLWWFLCIMWGITLIPALGYRPEYYHFPIAAFGVIYSWAMILVQLGRMPWFAVHIGMLVKISQDFLKLLFSFSSILIAFALGFSVLLPDHPYFNIKTLPSALFKSFVMMKGDIDYEGVLDIHLNPYMNSPVYSISAHLIYTAFVIVVTMLLTALLIGLVVKDIEEIGKKARVNNSIRLIKEIGILESAIRSPFLICGLSRFLCRQLSIEKLPEIERCFAHFSPIHPDDTTLPNEIKEKFVSYMSSCPCQFKRSMSRPAPVPSSSLA